MCRHYKPCGILGCSGPLIYLFHSSLNFLKGFYGGISAFSKVIRYIIQINQTIKSNVEKEKKSFDSWIL